MDQPGLHSQLSYTRGSAAKALLAQTIGEV